MENLTHTLTGIMLARAGLSRLTPRAVWITAIAANIPDIDAVSIVRGTETYFQVHRGPTHSLLFAPLMAVVPVLVVAAISRTKLPWLRAWLAAFIAVLSHLLLDFTNPYGIRLFLPFSAEWPALDATHVVDVWIWFILLSALIWPALAGLVSAEIGAKRGPGRGTAIAALFLLALYDTGRYFLHERAVETLESRVYDGGAPRRVLAFPQSINPMRWNGWVDTGRSWLEFPVDLTKEFDPKPAASYYQPEPNPLITEAQKLPIFQTLSAFARTPFWRVMRTDDAPGASKVELIDLRFGRGDRLGFTATAIFDASGRPVSTSFHY